MARENLFGLERKAIENEIAGLDEPAYRAKQVYSWLYRKRARSFDEMTDLGKELRRRLDESFQVRWPEVAERSLSYDHG